MNYKCILLLLITLFSSCSNTMSVKKTDTKDFYNYTDIKSAFKNPKRVKVLTLYDKGLNKIPDSICKFKNLIKLGLSDNNITEIPECMYKLRDLEILVITNTKISTISENIKNLKNLRVLHLYKNNIQSLPKSIVELKKLRSLLIFGNNISKENLKWIKKNMHKDCVIIDTYRI